MMRLRYGVFGVLSACMAALLLSASPQALAFDGYFSYGYGVKSLGRGGASIAFTDDAFGGANNPATVSWVGNRIEVGATLDQFVRGAGRTGSAGADFDETSGRHYFVIPEMAFSYQINERWSTAVTVYANGGLNTQYDADTLPAAACAPGAPGRRNTFCGTTKLGLNLNQLIIASTASYKLTPQLSVGFAPLIAVQSFKAEGLQFFIPLSGSPNEVTNKGTDYSYGYGARVGFLYRPFAWLNVGATYSSRLRMTPLNRYKGLLANGGRFDIPANYGVGLVLSPVPEFRIGLDWTRIQFGDVSSIANPSNATRPLGSPGGPAFGWRDVNAYKLALEYEPTPALTLRFGYNHSTAILDSQFVTFSILAPGVPNDHLTLGLTYRVTAHSEVSGFYMRWIEKAVTGSSSFPFGGAETLRMHANAFGLAYAYRF